MAWSGWSDVPVAAGLEDATMWAAAVRATSAAGREFYAVVRIDVGNDPSADPGIYEWQVVKILDDETGGAARD